MNSSNQIPDETELKKQFLENGGNFFRWNSGKNTPNILLALSQNISELVGTIRQSSETSERLAKSLNRITLIYVVLTGVSVGCLLLQTCGQQRREDKIQSIHRIETH